MARPSGPETEGPLQLPDKERAKASKARDLFLRIQPYNFFSFEQFGIEGDYYARIRKEPWGYCWGNCYNRVYSVFDNLANKLRRRPKDAEVLEKLDEGNASFYDMLCRAREEQWLLVEKVERSIPFWDKFYERWDKWFRDYYPEDFQVSRLFKPRA